MNSRIVINTGPLIAFGRMDCLETIRDLPFDYSSPEQVRLEIVAGNRLGYATAFPEWINVISLTDPPSKLTLSNLDAGEAAVIEAALQNNIQTVCLDELKGRRAAVASGLVVVGSLGILGRAKKLGLIGNVKPFVEKAQLSGIHYDQKLVDTFLAGLGEL
jgi:predicted nucleic acid-binding protein